MRSVAEAPPARSAVRILARGLLVPFVAGALCVFGFAPFYAWPVPIAGLAVLFLVWNSSGSALQAGLSGFAFGLGFFLAGVSWIYVSLHVYGSMPAALAALATFAVCAYCALFPAAAGWTAWRWGASEGPRLALMASAFVACEWLRSWLFSGFPWLTIGTSQAPSSPLVGFAPLVGAYGTSLAVASLAALGAAFAVSPRLSRRRYYLLGAFAAVFLAGGFARLVEWSSPTGAPVTVALLQGNIAQQLKWQEEVRTKTLLDYRQMVFDAKARVVILPETALPAFLDQLPPEYLESLREHGRREGKDILMGTVERRFRGEQFDYYNSLVSLTGDPAQAYRKRHLVPFGEYIPPGFKWVLAILKIPLSDFAVPATPPQPISAGGMRFGVAICYEDIFGEEMIAVLPGAQVLLNVSNDAWFGESFAAEQHLQTSQLRAIETARWMVRSTNTGVTAAIDERGRVVSRLPQFTRGTLVQEVTPRAGTTPYVYWGNAGALALVLLVAAPVWARRVASRKPPG